VPPLATLAVIPARFASTRLPGKVLADIHGKPMVQHVYERARRARRVERVVVATDDERVAAAVRGFGGEAVLTSPDHATGTDRMAEVAWEEAAGVIVNVQGDEPLIDPAAIDLAVAGLDGDPGLALATLCIPLLDVAEMLSPSVVKVVSDARGDALYFSRSPIPYVRVAGGGPAEAAAEAVRRGLARRHLGLYAFRREALLRFASLPPVPHEEAEGLEQLRALHHGLRIRVVEFAGEAGPAVDTPEDLERVRALFAPPPSG
jgi:3-deoxy-manno-octulosonate cytidylyltransferase (CMP-KDO synthetase)